MFFIIKKKNIQTEDSTMLFPYGAEKLVHLVLTVTSAEEQHNLNDWTYCNINLFFLFFSVVHLKQYSQVQGY